MADIIFNKKTEDPNYRKKYYDANREKILKKMYEKKICECGAVIVSCNMKRHMRSKRHTDTIDYKKNLQQKKIE